MHGTPLEEMGNPTAQIRAALDLAAQALANGEPVPQSACDLLAKPIIPNWL